MHTITGEVQDVLKNSGRFDLVHTESISNDTIDDFVLYQDHIVTYSKRSKKLGIHPKYGVGTYTDDHEERVKTLNDFEEEFLDIFIIGDEILLLGRTQIATVSITTIDNNKFGLGDPIISLNGMPTIYDTRLEVKFFHDPTKPSNNRQTDVFYFVSFDKVYIFDYLQKTLKRVYEGSYFILDALITRYDPSDNSYHGLVSFENTEIIKEPSNNSPFIVNFSTNSLSRPLQPLTVKEEYGQDPYLHRISHMSLMGYNKIYVVQRNGVIHFIHYDYRRDSYGKPLFIGKTTGSVSRIVRSIEAERPTAPDLIFVCNDEDDIFVRRIVNDNYNNIGKSDRFNSFIQTKGMIKEALADEIFFIVLTQVSNNLHEIKYYRLIDSFLTVKINGAGFLTGMKKKDGSRDHLLSLDIEVNDKAKEGSPINLNKNVNLNVKIDRVNPMNFDFLETANSTKRLYNFLEDIGERTDYINNTYLHENEDYLPNSLYMSDIVESLTHNSEENNAKYSITMGDVLFDSLRPIISGSFRNDLLLYDVRDMYHLGDYIYYRVRLLLRHPQIFNLFAIKGKDGRLKVTAYFNKPAEEITQEEKDAVVSEEVLRQLRELKNFYKPLIKPNEDFPEVDLTVYSSDDVINPIWDEHAWLRLDYPDIEGVKDDYNVAFLVGHHTSGTFNVIEPLDKEIYRKWKRSVQERTVRKVSYANTMYKTFDGDIKYLESNYTNSLNTIYDKDKEKDPIEFLMNSAKVSHYEGLMANNGEDFHITDLSTLVDGRPLTGFFNVPYVIDSKQPKSISHLVELYVNGRKIFNKYNRQFNKFDGLVDAYFPMDEVKPYLNDEISYQNLMNKNNTNKDFFQVVARKRNLNNTEDLITSHTISNEFQDEVSLIKTSGIYFNMEMHEFMSSDRMRVFIKGSSQDTFARINPENYSIKLDREYNQVILTIPGASYIDEGTQIMIVSNGITDRTIFYDKLSDLYDIDSVPLLQTTNGKYLMITGKKADDLDINVNGYTLVPNVDFNVIDQVDFKGNPLSLVVFRNILPKEIRMEINFLDEAEYKTHYFTGETLDNFFAVNDDDIFLTKEGDYKANFELFINNRSISPKFVNIVHGKLFEVDLDGLSEIIGIDSMIKNFDYSTEDRRDYLIHVMIRVHVSDNHNYKDYVEASVVETKDRIVGADGRTHTKRVNVASNTMFDKICDFRPSKSSSKFALAKFLKDIEESKLLEFEDTRIDTNLGNPLGIDISIDGSLINSQYVKENLFINANKNFNKNYLGGGV